MSIASLGLGLGLGFRLGLRFGLGFRLGLGLAHSSENRLPYLKVYIYIYMTMNGIQLADSFELFD